MQDGENNSIYGVNKGYDQFEKAMSNQCHFLSWYVTWFWSFDLTGGLKDLSKPNSTEFIKQIDLKGA